MVGSCHCVDVRGLVYISQCVITPKTTPDVPVWLELFTIRCKTLVGKRCSYGTRSSSMIFMFYRILLSFWKKMFPSGISEVLSCGITTSSESKLESCIGNIWRKINLRTASCATRLVRRRRRERMIFLISYYRSPSRSDEDLMKIAKRCGNPISHHEPGWRKSPDGVAMASHVYFRFSFPNTNAT